MLKTRHSLHLRTVLFASALFALLLALACDGGSDEVKQPEGITVVVATGELPTPAPVVLNPLPAQAPITPLAGPPLPLPPPLTQSDATSGGKPATPPAAFTALPAIFPTASTPTTATTSRITMDGTSQPSTGRWIDVDVNRYQVRLMNGTDATRVISPVGVGAQVDSGAYESTQTGTFRVHNKIAGLQYDAPYKTYISDWVGFDAARANGFHSLLKDAKGNIVDPSTGRISNGCIRVGDSAAIFAYAEIGMVVFVHH